MTRSSLWNGALALVGAAAVVVDFRISPVAVGASATLFAAVLWLVLRREAEQHRHPRRHRLRRRVGTVALVSAGAWVALAVVRAFREAISSAGDPVRAGGQLVDTPWPGTFLVAGLVTIGALALIVVATVASRRRHSTHDRPSPAPAVHESR